MPPYILSSTQMKVLERMVTKPTLIADLLAEEQWKNDNAVELFLNQYLSVHPGRNSPEFFETFDAFSYEEKDEYMSLRLSEVWANAHAIHILARNDTNLKIFKDVPEVFDRAKFITEFNKLSPEGKKSCFASFYRYTIAGLTENNTDFMVPIAGMRAHKQLLPDLSEKIVIENPSNSINEFLHAWGLVCARYQPGCPGDVSATNMSFLRNILPDLALNDEEITFAKEALSRSQYLYDKFIDIMNTQNTTIKAIREIASELNPAIFNLSLSDEVRNAAILRKQEILQNIGSSYGFNNEEISALDEMLMPHVLLEPKAKSDTRAKSCETTSFLESGNLIKKKGNFITEKVLTPNGYEEKKYRYITPESGEEGEVVTKEEYCSNRKEFSYRMYKRSKSICANFKNEIEQKMYVSFNGNWLERIVYGYNGSFLKNRQKIMSENKKDLNKLCDCVIIQSKWKNDAYKVANTSENLPSRTHAREINTNPEIPEIFKTNLMRV